MEFVKGLVLWATIPKGSSLLGVVAGHPRGVLVRTSDDGLPETRDLEQDQWLIVINICKRS